MGKNIWESILTIPLQSYRCKGRWEKMDDTLVSGKSAFQVM